MDPAPQAVFDDAQPAGRIFTAILGGKTPAAEADVEARLVREIRYDPDVWIVEVEDRARPQFSRRRGCIKSPSAR